MLCSQAIVWSTWSWQLKILRNCLTIPVSTSHAHHPTPPLSTGLQAARCSSNMWLWIHSCRRRTNLWHRHAKSSSACRNLDWVFNHWQHHYKCKYEWRNSDHCPQALPIRLLHSKRQWYIHLENPDEQCEFNRSAVLCGQCKRGYSLVLGSNRCRKCQNTYTCCVWSSWYGASSELSWFYAIWQWLKEH